MKSKFLDIENYPWWQLKIAELLKIAEGGASYVYHLPSVLTQINKLKQLSLIQEIYYALKANPHPDILTTIESQGLGFECVSLAEIQHVLNYFPDLNRKRILFTPNFAAKSEYIEAFALGCHVTIDNLYILTHWADILSHQHIFLRIDPGFGAGHHQHVKTGGNLAKFGIAYEDVDKALSLASLHHIEIDGLHAHTGSGIFTPETWQDTARILSSIAKKTGIKIINIGGGFGVPDSPSQAPFDIESLQAHLSPVVTQDSCAYWIESGRYLVAEAGVLLARVTQTKNKGDITFIGLETGMNSLLRPSLYHAYHHIVNLSRINEPSAIMANIVGPICESGDTLGLARHLPKTLEGDVFLIATAGAYGHVMSSNYNLRAPARETILKH